MKAIFVLALVVAVATALPRSFRFNRPGFETKIIGGEDAGEKEFPYYVALGIRWPWGTFDPICGGVIYDEIRIVTNAACAKGLSEVTVDVYVVTNSYDFNDAVQNPRNNRKVVGQLWHEDFNEHTLENNIGIVIMDYPLVYTDRVQPGRLGLNMSGISGDVVAMGHGSVTKDGYDTSNILQKVTLKTITRNECTQHYVGLDGAPTISQSTVCTYVEDKSFCSYDQGGPLVAKDDAGRDYIAAVSSYSAFPCGIYPNVYTEIAPHRAWLESKLNN